MTEFEIASLAFYEAEAMRHQVEIIRGLASQLESKFTGFSSLLFGYVLVAYFAGKNLTRNQVIILTMLYIATISQYILTSLMVGLGIVSNSLELVEIGGTSQPVMNEIVVTPARYYFSTVVQFACVIASLYFMWSVRHPRPQ